MDNHEWKRREEVARVLAESAMIIILMLRTLDDIRLFPHMGDDMRERIAEDFTMVYRDIIPGVDASGPVRALIRTILHDWVILNDLVMYAAETDFTPRRMDTIEELANRLAVALSVLQEMKPDLFQD